MEDRPYIYYFYIYMQYTVRKKYAIYNIDLFSNLFIYLYTSADEVQHLRWWLISWGNVAFCPQLLASFSRIKERHQSLIHRSLWDIAANVIMLGPYQETALSLILTSLRFTINHRGLCINIRIFHGSQSKAAESGWTISQRMETGTATAVAAPPSPLHYNTTITKNKDNSKS